MEYKLSNEYISVLGERSFRITAERLVLRCGVRADLKGFQCLADAVILYGSGLCSGVCEIYRIIGEYRKLKQKSVMREISYSLAQAFDLPTHLSKLIGAPILSDDIHSSLVISYLGSIFRNPDLSVYA